MAGVREIKRRIKAVKATAQVTRAMQLVAASKMKHAQRTAVSARPYAQLLAEFLQKFEPELWVKEPLFQKREIKRRGFLIISTDKGLCGGLLTNLNREILHLPQNALYVAVGKRAAQTLMRLNRELAGEFSLSDRVRFRELRAACEKLFGAYREGKIDTLEVLYTEYLSPLQQTPRLETILPLADFESVLASFPKDYTAEPPLEHDKRPFIIEPAPAEVLHALITLYIKKELYQTALEAKASEHSARMVAMKNATDNAENLRAELSLSYNKARQAAITNEILEIAAATSAGGG